MTVRVLHLSDSHVKTTPARVPPDSLADGVAALRGGETTLLTLQRLLDHIGLSTPPDVTLHTGDLADDGAEESYLASQKVLRTLHGSVEVVPGNHDDVDAMASCFPDCVRPIRTVDLGAWQLVLVNSAGHGREHGHLPSATLAAMEQLLDADPRPALLAMHHPPIPACQHADCRLANADALLDLIGRHGNVRAVASGHLHMAAEYEHDGVAYLLGPSTCMQLDHTHPLPENNTRPTPLGARSIQLHGDGSVDSQLIWL